jgi:hypothetical protein
MTLTIEVPAEVESALEAKARRRGVAVDELLRGVVSDFARVDDARSDAFDAELDALLHSQPDARAVVGLGPLPDDAIEASYREREDAQL